MVLNDAKSLKTMAVFRSFVMVLMSMAAFQIPRAGVTANRHGENSSNYWKKQDRLTIKKALAYTPNIRIAKNLILFVGDGMGLSTLNAARIHRGQERGTSGEENLLEFERFPHLALLKTYSVDKQTPDGAAAATALLTGVKTRNRVIGLDANAPLKTCNGTEKTKLLSILKWAKASGLKTGIVTNTALTHATPAAAYAHIPDRGWQSDVTLPEENTGCKDMARQLVEDNSDINVLFGGGRTYFLPNSTTDPETNKVEKHQRQDGRNLVEQWQKDKKDRMKKHKFVWNLDGFDKINTNRIEYALGLFEPYHMKFELDRDRSADTGEPSLAQMTSKAVKMLQNGGRGFFLLVEGGRIDHAHHGNGAGVALNETLALEDAVIAALGLVDPKNTLVVVTADHSVGLDITGYASRGANILDVIDLDAVPHRTILQYANGPGHRQLHKPEGNILHMYPSGVPLEFGTHSGEDVPVFAQGPMAHLFRGTQEQTFVSHVMAFAACIGPYTNNCDRH